MTKINYVDIEMAENGFVVCWSEKTESSNSFEHCGYVDKKKLFPMDDEGDAWNFYKDKKMECLKAKNNPEKTTSSEY
jgi:hypothetical protein